MAESNLTERIAVVTGATGGMGTATATALSGAGWKDLLICDLDAGKLETLASSLRSTGAKVAILAGDVSDPVFPDRMVGALGEKQIGAVVHMAGISPRMAEAERILEVNLGATIRLVDGGEINGAGL